jgi:hypothetical protein
MLGPNDCLTVYLDTTNKYKVLAIEYTYIDYVGYYTFTLVGMSDKVTLALANIENIKHDKIFQLKGHEVYLSHAKNGSGQIVEYYISPVKPWIFNTIEMEGDKNMLNDAFDGFPNADWNID